LSTFNYNKVYQKALKRVRKYGREITFVQLDPGPDNAAQPWKGTATPRETPLSTLVTHGVFVEPESLERLGKARVSNEFVKSAEQVIILAHNESLGQFDEVIDRDGSRWKIANIQSLGPGDFENLLHYVRVQRRGHTTAVRGALL
jgi:hypothetical protein